MTKYQRYFQEMMAKHQELFSEFKRLHDLYKADPQIYQEEYNDKGKIIVEIIREWEKRVCQQSERGQYGKFSAKLADKFWSEVRAYFPKIDFVGVR